MAGFYDGTTSCHHYCFLDEFCNLVVSGIELSFSSGDACEEMITVDIHSRSAVGAHVRHDIYGFEA